MSIKEEIDKAIAAHGQWKGKLRTAIDTGQCESTPDRVKKDNNCSFGKWLHTRIDDSHKNSQHYKVIVDLHAKFHQEAGSILELAMNGDKEAASEKMGLGKPFRHVSAELTAKLNEWKADL